MATTTILSRTASPTTTAALRGGGEVASSWMANNPFHLSGNSSSSNSNNKPQSANNRDQDFQEGWVWIQVFYGKPSEPDPPAASDEKSDPSLQQQKQPSHQQRSHQWFSQAHQDEVVSSLFKKKRGGFFVDLAANDATIISNSFALERYYGWKGVCIEPNPIYWKNLSSFRSCDIVAAVVGRHRMDEVHFRFEGAEYGGIAAEGFDNNQKFQSRSVLQYTVTLYEVLQRANAPREIDYFSFDVEGAESYILMPEDWDENESNTTTTTTTTNNDSSSSSSSLTQPPAVLDYYRFKVISGERLRGPIRKYLKSKGYEFVERLSNWGESLWIHQSAVEELDLGVLRRLFPRKCENDFCYQIKNAVNEQR